MIDKPKKPECKDDEGAFPSRIFPKGVFPRNIFPWMGEDDDENEENDKRNEKY